MDTMLTRGAFALAILTAFIISLVAAPVAPVRAASSTSNTVQGVVTFTDGSPAAGATVSIRGEFGLSDIADASGSYSISGIDSGFAIVDAVIVSGGATFTGSAFVGFAPGGGSTATANIVVRNFGGGPFPPFPG